MREVERRRADVLRWLMKITRAAVVPLVSPAQEDSRQTAPVESLQGMPAAAATLKCPFATRKWERAKNAAGRGTALTRRDRSAERRTPVTAVHRIVSVRAGAQVDRFVPHPARVWSV